MILAILLAAVSFAGATLSQPGEWHGDDVAVRNGEKVLVLIEKAQLHCVLEQHTVKVTPVKDDVVDRGSAKTGKKVSVPDEPNVVAIIARAPGLKPGDVETIQVDAEDQAKRENPTTFHFHGVEWRMEVRGGDLIVSNGKETQTLVTGIDDEGMPAWVLYWAGDMDHDGKLDLLYDVNTFNVVRSELALSSAAGKGELVKVVARESHSGC